MLHAEYKLYSKICGATRMRRKMYRHNQKRISVDSPCAVSIVIPTLNAGRYLERLLQRIAEQSGPLCIEVIIVDSASDDDTASIARSFPFVHFIKIPRAEFTHGRARNLGVSHAQGKYVAFLSQDALPRDEFWLPELLRPLMDDPWIAGAFSRQVPRAKAPPMERFFLKSCFPDSGQHIRKAQEDSKLSLQDVFYSNVSSAARRTILQRFPFDEQLIMSEDQAFARDLLRAGYATAYQPSSVVIHSHQYSYWRLFQRYFDSAYSLKCIFGQNWAETVDMGKSIMREEMSYMLKYHPTHLPRYICYLAAKITGTAAGLNAQKLPRFMKKILSLHKGYWERRIMPVSHKHTKHKTVTAECVKVPGE